MQITHTLPSEIHQEQPTSTPHSMLRRLYYDTFAFRDRVTNHTFQYRQARRNSQPSNQSIHQSSSANNQPNDAKRSLDIYRFMKSFEMDCLRSKYLRQPRDKPQPEKKQKTRSEKHPQGIVSKQVLYQINKQEMKRILETNDSVNADILQLNKTKKLPPQTKGRNLKKSSTKWRFLDTNTKDNENIVPGEVERRITEKIVNHMKNQMKSNCEYLLNMPIQKKKKAMFNNQLKKHSQNKKFIFPKYSHSELDLCRMSKIMPASNASLIVGVQTKSNINGQLCLTDLVKRGYISQVLLQLKNDPSLCSSKDDALNNILHIAAKEGNIEMMGVLLQAIPVRSCLALLLERNHLKRSPRDKAVMYGNLEVVAMLDTYLKENKYLIM